MNHTAVSSNYADYRRWIWEHKGAPNMPLSMMRGAIRRAWEMRKVLRRAAGDAS